MNEGFYWTARLFEDGKPTRAKFFPAKAERDDFVSGHKGWKKRGKICAENLEKHLLTENADFKKE